MKISERKVPISVELTAGEQQFLISFSSLLYNCVAEFGDDYYDDDSCLRDYFDKIINACREKQTSENPIGNLTYDFD